MHQPMFNWVGVLYAAPQCQTCWECSLASQPCFGYLFTSASHFYPQKESPRSGIGCSSYKLSGATQDNSSSLHLTFNNPLSQEHCGNKLWARWMILEVGVLCVQLALGLLMPQPLLQVSNHLDQHKKMASEALGKVDGCEQPPLHPTQTCCFPVCPWRTETAE